MNMYDFEQRFGGGILGGQQQPFVPFGGQAPPRKSGLADFLPTLGNALASGFAGGRDLQTGLAEADRGAQQIKQKRIEDNQKAAVNAWLQAGAPKDPNHPAMRGLFEAVPALAERYALSQMGGPEKPMTVSAGDRLWDPATRSFLPDQGGGGSAYGGTSMDAQNWNIILKGKTDAPEYAAAYNQLFETPKMAPGQGPNGEITQTPYYPPVPPGVKPPAGGAGPAAPQVPGVRTGQPIATGEKRPPEAVVRNRELYKVASKELPIVEKNFGDLANLGNQAAGAGGNASRWLASSGYQRAFHSLQTIVASYLYSTSGATANPAEVIKQTQVLMPAPGEAAASVADKKARVRTMVEAIGEAAQLKDEGQPTGGETQAPQGITHIWDPETGLRPAQ